MEGPPASDRAAGLIWSAGTGAVGDGHLPSRPGVRYWIRPGLIWVLGIAGLISYNWWLLAVLKPGLMRSPDELFSNLEVSGQPFAAAMQHADLASGLLLLAAFLTAGRGSSRRLEWLAMMGFAAAGTLGGMFPEVCADAVDAGCRRSEWNFQLPLSQYVHLIAGIAEFAAITIALLLALRRTRDQETRVAATYRGLAKSALIAYPLLGAAYLTDRMGGVMEAVFFTGFTVMVVAQLADRTGSRFRHSSAASITACHGYCQA